MPTASLNIEAKARFILGKHKNLECQPIRIESNNNLGISSTQISRILSQKGSVSKSGSKRDITARRHSESSRLGLRFWVSEFPHV